MRTWSVSGTALALCTRSSSLSMRTRTSIGLRILLLRTQGGAGTSAWKELPEASRHGVGHELVDASAEGRDLLDPAGRDEAVRGTRHHVQRLDLRREQPV